MTYTIPYFLMDNKIYEQIGERIMYCRNSVNNRY